MAASTVYDIKVKFGVEDSASPKLASLLKTGAGLAIGFISAQKAASLLGNALGSAVRSGLRYAEAVDDITKRFTTLTELHSDLGRGASMHAAIVLTNNLEQAALKGAGSFEKLTAATQQLFAPIANAGGSMAQLKAVTETVVPLAAAFGVESSQAATTIQRALTGTLTAKDQFARQLGIIPEEFNKLAKENPEAALQKMTAILQSPAVQTAVKQQMSDIDNVLGRLHQAFNMLSRAFVGGPGAALTATLEKFANFITSKMPGIMAVASQVGAVFSTLIESAGEMFGFLTNSGNNFVLGFVKLLDSVRNTVVIFQALITNIFIGVDNAVRFISTGIENIVIRIENAFNKLKSKLPGGGDYQAIELKTFQALSAESPELNKLQRLFAEAQTKAAIKEVPNNEPLLPPDMRHTGKSTQNVKVTINRLEVASDDPDRFAFNLVSAFQDFTKSPSQAANALREG